jgi:hypothetical protein
VLARRKEIDMDMTYTDVKGIVTKYWLVSGFSSGGGGEDLQNGDLLVFSDSVGTIARYRPGGATDPFDHVLNWATGCTHKRLDPGGTYSLEVTGTHKSNNPVIISFIKAGTGKRAHHDGKIVFPSPTTSATWMADEGP